MDFRNIGKALRLLRIQRVMKQREVARAAGITPAMLSAYETGKHRPSLDTTERVLAAMQCDVLDLAAALRDIRVREEEAARKEREKEGAAEDQDTERQAFLERGLEGADLNIEEREVLASLVPGILKLIRYLKG